MTAQVAGFHVVVVVWGETYLKLFLDLALPALFAPGNLPALPSSPATQFRIYTRGEDVPLIRASASFETLSHMLPVVFEPITQCLNQDHDGAKYTAITHAHDHAARAAAQAQCAMILMAPDMILANGGIHHLVKLAEQGFRAVSCGNLRVISETMAPKLHQRITPEGILPLSPRELIGLALEHLHPDTSRGFIDSPRFKNHWPDFLYWRVEDHGMLQRGIFHHPLLTVPHQEAGITGMTCDGADYIQQICPDPDDFHIVEDSDHVCFVDLTPAHASEPEPPAEDFSVLRVATWMLRHTYPSHHHFTKHKIRLHAQPLNTTWDHVEAQSDTVIAAVERCRDFLKSEPLAYDDMDRFRIQNIYKIHWDAMVSHRVSAIMDQLDGRPLVIFGAGEHTRMLLRATNLHQYPVRLADSNPEKWGRTIDGLPCISPEQIPAFANHVLISSRAFERDIARDLKERHGETLTIFGLYNLSDPPKVGPS